MTGGTSAEGRILSLSARRALGAGCVLLLLLLLIGAASIPFTFESQSIRYKLGIDKTLLRTGKVLGMLAATLLLFQLVLSARIKVLDRIFALNRLYVIHRVNALIIAVLALFHPLFIFAPEDIRTIPVEIKYWPEVLGSCLLMLIWLITASGIWRLFLNFPFDRWWLFHRGAVFLAVVMLMFHVLFGSDTFESGWPRLIVILSAVLYVLILLRVKIKPLLLKRNPYVVTNITKAGKDTFSIEMSPQKGSIMRYLPGQFAFISLASDNLPAEEHPFTISSTPTGPDNVCFTIRCSGDWTSRIGTLSPGDHALLDGPYGHFSHRIHNSQREFVMIAGGIGITPMLSMLRYIVDRGDSPRITLIWSNRTKDDIVFPDEFEDLERRLTGLRIIYVFTRQSSGNGTRHRLNRVTLEKLLSGCSRQAAAFVCGPPLMMKEVKQSLLALGHSPHLIFTEEFRL